VLQSISEVFPKNFEGNILSDPLAIDRCIDCYLVQLKHRYPHKEMYVNNYCYRPVGAVS